MTDPTPAMSDEERARIAAKAIDEAWGVDWLGTGSGKNYADDCRKSGLDDATALIASALSAARDEERTRIMAEQFECIGKIANRHMEPKT